MKRTPLRALAIGLSLPCTALAAEQANDAPDPAVLWTLDQATRVGGHPAEILGAPAGVEVDGRAALQFDGVDDGLLVPANPLAHCRAFTIEILLRPAADGNPEQRFLHLADGDNHRVLIELRMVEGGQWCVDTFLRAEDNFLTLIDRSLMHPPEQWTWVALTYDGDHMAHFVNGVRECEGRVKFAAMTGGRASIGVRLNQVYWYRGQIAEVRFHHDALGAGQLQRTP